MRSSLILLVSGAAVSIGCSRNNLPMQTLDHDGVEREYFLHAPASHDGVSNLPLLFNFHGFDGTASSQLDWADFRSLADEHEFWSFILKEPK